MSIFDRERKRLGITPLNRGSIFAEERAALSQQGQYSGSPTAQQSINPSPIEPVQERSSYNPSGYLGMGDMPDKGLSASKQLAELPEPSPNTLRGGLLGLADKTLGRFSKGFTDTYFPGVIDAQNKRMTDLGTTNPIVQRLSTEPQGFLEKGAGIAGTIGGYVAPSGLAYKAISKPAQLGYKALTKGKDLGVKGKIGLEASKGALAGGVISAGETARDEAFVPGRYTAKEHLAKGGINILAGAALDPFIVVGGPKALGAIKKFFGKDKVKQSELAKALDDPTTPQEVKDEILMLPEGKTILRPRETPQPIKENFVSAKKNPSYYADRLEEFRNVAMSQNLPPGREKEAMEEIWRNMSRYDESITLDKLIELGTPSLKQLNKRTSGNLKNPAEPNQFGVSKADQLGVNTRLKDNPINFTMMDKKPLEYVGRMAPMNKVKIQKGTSELTPKLAQSESTPSFNMTSKDTNIDYPFEAGGLKSSLNQANKEVAAGSLESLRPKLKSANAQSFTPAEQAFIIAQKQYEPLAKKSFKEWTDADFALNEKIRKPLQAAEMNLQKQGYGPDDIEAFMKRNEGGKQTLNSSKLEPPPLKSLRSKEALSSQTDTLASKAKEEKLNPFLENSAEWKNKWTPALKRETMERNFDDIMGADAPKMKEEYLEPIKISEATRTRFLDKNRNEVRGLGIKFKSEDDKLVQQYGEKVITLDELKNKTKNWKQVEKAADTMRAKYDELFDTLNEALVSNGYPAVTKRKDYFPHYEEIDNMFTKLGFDIRNFELPTEIIGRTQNFKPGKNFFGNILKRKGDQTTFGFIEGFDRYIEGASRVIHHTKNIKKLRKLENDIRGEVGDGTHLGSFVADLQDYTNNLSGKQSASDRGLESNLGRGVYTVLDAFRRRVSLNMIGGNIGAALTNFISVTHSLATNSKKEFAEGLYDAAKNIFKKDGFVNESNFLTRRYGSDRLAQGKLDKVIDKSMVFMREFDRFASNIIVRSKFKEGLTKGLPRKEALKQADNWAAKIMADRSLGQMPTYFNSKSLGTLIQFQLEVNNQISFLMKDIPRTFRTENGNMSKKQVASALGQVAVFGFLYNEMFEKMAGRRVALDPIGLVVKAFEDFTNPEIDKSRAAANTVKNTTDQLPFTSIFTGGRIPMGAAFPSPKAIMERPSLDTIKEEAYKPLTYLLPPTAGGQIKKTYQGLTAMNKNPLAKQEMSGLYQENPKGEKYLKYPIKNSLSNNLKAPIFGKYSTPETEEYYGNKRRPLSPLQTKKLERAESSGRDTNRLYNNLQIDRRIGTLETKIKDTRRDKRLTLQEKQKEVEKLRKLIKELKESRVR